MGKAATKSWLGQQAQYQYFWLGIIVAVTAIIHFVMLWQSGTNTLIFDEAHYIKDARAILAGQVTTTPEHPSFAKLFIVLGLDLFGDNSLGWRFFSIVAGTVTIIFFYLICRRLGLSRKATLFATGLLAFENLTFIQASVAMLDIYTIATMMIAFWLYLRGNYLPMAVVIALSGLTKLTGLLIIPAILLHWVITRRDRIPVFAGAMALVPVSFLILMPLTDYATFHTLKNPIERLSSMLGSMGSLTFASAAHPSMSRAWEWIIKPLMMPYWYTPHYVSALSYTIWVFAIPVIGYMAYLAKKGNNAAWFVCLWFASTYVVWIPLGQITDRVTFIFYFAPTVGALCIGFGMALEKLMDMWKSPVSLQKQQWAAISIITVFLVVHLAVFGFLSPLNDIWKYPIPPA